MATGPIKETAAMAEEETDQSAKDDDTQADANDQPAKDDHNDQDEPLGDGGKRALQSERKARQKAEADAKKARDELAALKQASDASKSDLQKLTDRLEAAEKRQAEAEQKALRAEVAQAKKLTPAQAKRLQGSTREELEDDADELLEAFAPPPSDKDDTADQKADAAKSRRPKERLRPGASPDAEPAKSGEELADAITKRARGF